MKVRLLKTEGQGHFEEVAWEVPELGPRQIRVEAIMTGVCRSDIDMMVGKFGPLPDHMQGHEGLGRVIELGRDLKRYDSYLRIGDLVATRGEPAYADVYNCDVKNSVVVPEVNPKYILEPVACGINLIMGKIKLLETSNTNSNYRVAIIGTGFLAWVAAHTLKRHLFNNYLNYELDVIGNSNRDLWNTIRWSEYGVVKPQLEGQYDAIIDISSSGEYINQDIFNPGCQLVIASEKHPEVKINFSRLLWNNVSIYCPSPRDKSFQEYMGIARNWIKSGDLTVDRFWTKGYNRDTEWRQAFSDGLDRPRDYSRGFIWWNNG